MVNSQKGKSLVFLGVLVLEDNIVDLAFYNGLGYLR